MVWCRAAVLRAWGSQGNCVEVADQAGRVLVRDTKDRTGPMLSVSVDAWRKFADQVHCRRHRLLAGQLTDSLGCLGYRR
jgi:hypothetical protein